MLASIASLLFLSFAVSIDGFGVGITYGVRKIKIPAGSVLIISACSGLVIFVSMLVGKLLMAWMSPHGASAAGAVILIGIGLWTFIQFIRNGEAESRNTGKKEVADAPSTVLRLEIRQLGIIIQILRTPSAADVDRSGIITTGEALLLGAALSLDAFGAGIGAGLIGFPPIITAVVIMAASGSFLWTGTQVGFRVAGWRWVRQLSALPGLILIAMGLLRLL
ncbi:sporulation membrane protein YtaF [Cohnella pontilimi]|uniref:Sporulation membrane protein YtaF n=1 Tax=Cohnella pontilimi TaxID=2564100 RepID=A0A4U0F509_9BACL|nr:sporulation membrane protein YtaF [Cohnella pontilimi]TJY39697.1 sporulation membrane protein YtaF [Cohnella pontilimi]